MQLAHQIRGAPTGSPFLFSEQEANVRDFIFGKRGDMVERGLIMAAIVVAAVAIWFTIGQKLAVKLGVVDAAVGG